MEVWDSKVMLAGVFLIIAMIDDLRSRKIHNYLNLSFLILSLIFVVVTSGWSGLWVSFSSVMTVAVFGYPLFRFKIIGGGDYKLLVAIAPLLSWELLFTLMIFSFIWGAVLGLIKTALDKDLKNFLHNLLAILQRKAPTQSKLHFMPFSVALLFGWLSCLAFSRMGVSLL